MNLSLSLLVWLLAGPSPTLVPLADSVNRGEVRAGPLLEHTFTLRHAGDTGTLVIRSVTPGCGCLQAKLAHSKLAPGETTTLEVLIQTVNQPTGPVRWRVGLGYEVLSDEGFRLKAGTCDCLVDAEVIREVDVQPTGLEVRADAGITYSIVLTDRRLQPLRVQSIRTSSAQLIAEVADAKPGHVRLEVKVAPEGEAGESEETVAIRTDDPLHPEIVVPVRVVRRAPARITATPSEVVFRPAIGESTLSHLIQLRGDDEEIEIADCTSSDPAIRVTWPKGARSITAIRVYLTPGENAAGGEAEVQVHLAKPEGETVVIPIIWRSPNGERP